MPIDDLTALGQKMREARKKKDLTQQELADQMCIRDSLLAVMEFAEIFPRNPKHFFRIGCFADFFKEGLLQLSLTCLLYTSRCV